MKGQSSIEFIILVSFVMLSFIVFSAFIYQNYAEKNQDKKNILVNNVIYEIEEEIRLAESSSDGYTREFSIPNKIENSEYNVSIIEDMLYIKTSDNKFSSALRISLINGQVKIGTNIISKQGGLVYINNGS